MALDNNNTPMESEVVELSRLKSWFVTGAKPTQSQFHGLLSSYYHKSSQIPMSGISGLSTVLGNKADASQLQYYAKVDASNINTQAWKDALNVGELPANIATIDYVDENGFTQNGNAYKKVDNPDNGKRGTYVLGIDGRAVAIDDFGKNVTNSNNTTNGSYVQTQSEGDTWVWNTNGEPYSITELPNKSDDSLFTDFLGKNSDGQIAKVGFSAFKDTANSWTNAQRLEFVRILNDNASQEAMSIGAIYPSVMPLENYDTTFIITGANLNLSQVSRKVEILDLNYNVLLTVEGDKITVISPTELTFTKNIYELGEGEYKIKVWSGVANTTSEMSLQVLVGLSRKDLSGLSWNILTNSNYSNTLSVGAGVTGIIKQENVSSVPSLSTFISMKSSPAFLAGEDWYVEIQLTDAISTDAGMRGYNSTLKNTFGVMYNSTANNLLPLGLVYYGQSFLYYAGGTVVAYNFTLNNNQFKMTTGYSTTVDSTIVILKQGNVLKITGEGKTSTTIISNNEDYSFVTQLISHSSGVSNKQLSWNIIKAYKLN
ncbi:hypothetical protein ACFOWU_10005 [Epilithonimonas zeae]|uniref:Uncharacterized protein n=1 Tax=Epilithonimonas zeae TaxID=1416779 RepID=A0A1N6GVS8_9FLAO|nr:hypothetical protein [Epilithonimonas zeae]SIO11628.1 hypothetical protein SAMN05444409_2085 [Epilithonimonas zeae]